MTLKLDIPEDLEAGLLNQARVHGLSLEAWAEQVLRESTLAGADQSSDASVAAVTRRLATFGERHGLSLGGITIKDLLHESRP